jgi:hypothetical protein
METTPNQFVKLETPPSPPCPDPTPESPNDVNNRTVFLDNIRDLRQTTLPSGAFCKAKDCGRPLAEHKTDYFSETAVLLHGAHHYGEDCAIKHLQQKNTCPICSEVLFDEDPDEDDHVNLLRIWQLQILQRRQTSKGNPERRDQLYNSWRQLADDRAEAFINKQVNVNQSDYGLYTHRKGARLRHYPKGLYMVDAEVLIDQLNHMWDVMFQKAGTAAAASIRDSACEHTSKLEAPCHPMTAKVRQQMEDIIHKLDGFALPPLKLLWYLNSEFSWSELSRQINDLQAKRQLPQGFFIYQGQLVEGVMRRFIECPIVMERSKISRQQGSESGTEDGGDAA